MDPSFKDIVVIGIDKDRSLREDSVVYVHVALSADPPHAWVERFKKEWITHLPYAVSLRGRYVVIPCHVVDPSAVEQTIDQKELDELGAFVATINAQYRAQEKLPS